MNGLDFIPDALKKKLIKLNEECEYLKTAYQPKKKVINGIVFSDEDVVLGNETEYLIVSDTDIKELGDEMIKKFLSWFQKKCGILWTKDGAKIYIDGYIDNNEDNRVLEISSPECKSIKELIRKMEIMNFYANSLLGKFRNLLVKEEKEIADSNPYLRTASKIIENTNWFVVKRKLNPSGDKGLGEHVNIQMKVYSELIKKILEDEHEGEPFCSAASLLLKRQPFHEFLMSLCILSGSGWLGRSAFFGGKIKYLISPTFEILKRINSLDEIPKDEIVMRIMQGRSYASDDFERIEIVTYSDNSISDKSIRLKFGCLMLYLKCNEFDCLRALKKACEIGIKNLDFNNPRILSELFEAFLFYPSNFVWKKPVPESFYDDMLNKLLKFDFSSKYKTIFGRKNLIEHQTLFLEHVRNCLDKTVELNNFFEQNYGCAPLVWPLETLEIIKEWQETLNNLKSDFLAEESLDWIAIMKKIAKELKCHPLDLNKKLEDEGIAKKAMRIDFSCRRVDLMSPKFKKSDFFLPNRRAFVRKKLFDLFFFLRKIPKLKRTLDCLEIILRQRFDGRFEDGDKLYDGIIEFDNEKISLFKEIFSSGIISNLTEEYLIFNEENNSIMISLPSP